MNVGLFEAHLNKSLIWFWWIIINVECENAHLLSSGVNQVAIDEEGLECAWRFQWFQEKKTCLSESRERLFWAPVRFTQTIAFRPTKALGLLQYTACKCWEQNNEWGTNFFIESLEAFSTIFQKSSARPHLDRDMNKLWKPKLPDACTTPPTKWISRALMRIVR